MQKLIYGRKFDREVSELIKWRNGMDKRQGCSECSYIKMYEYGNKIYYCDHEGRIDDMGKLGAVHLSVSSPDWCPLRNNENKH